MHFDIQKGRLCGCWGRCFIENHISLPIRNTYVYKSKLIGNIISLVIRLTLYKLFYLLLKRFDHFINSD